MKKVLVLNSSLNGEQGNSTKLSQQFVEQLANNQQISVTTRDLSDNAIAHLTQTEMAAWMTDANERSDEQKALAAISDDLIAELNDNDLIVIGMPMYNFGIPSTFKAWIDRIARAGITFKYTEQGAVMLAARRRGADVRIEVWDTGPGIPEAERALIFEEFQRGPGADRTDIGGFGLGLSIVKRMADALGHPINFCSRVGHGTLFTVSPPFAATVDTRSTPNTRAGCGRPYGLAGAKVVVIDNDATVLEAMQTLLERWSCEARAVPSLAELNSLIDEGFRPEIMLADYHLNNSQCGLDAVEYLRTEIDPKLPVIVVTADHSPTIADRARTARCDILLKPVKPAELRALMVHLLA